MKNKYEVEGDTVIIFIESPKYGVHKSLIDLEDMPLIKDHKWFINKRGYILNNKGAKIHRFILDIPPGSVIDHISGDKTDNRKKNLRICTQADNTQNLTALRKDNTSGARGVHFCKHINKWVAQLQVNKKKKMIGTFTDKEKAIVAVKEARAKYLPFSQEALKETI